VHAVHVVDEELDDDGVVVGRPGGARSEQRRLRQRQRLRRRARAGIRPDTASGRPLSGRGSGTSSGAGHTRAGVDVSRSAAVA